MNEGKLTIKIVSLALDAEATGDISTDLMHKILNMNGLETLYALDAIVKNDVGAVELWEKRQSKGADVRSQLRTANLRREAIAFIKKAVDDAAAADHDEYIDKAYFGADDGLPAAEEITASGIENAMDKHVYPILEHARAYPEGFTYDLRKGAAFDRDYGYVVAIDTKDNHDQGCIPQILALAKKHNLHLVGGWWDEETESYHFDACTWFETVGAAIKFGFEQNQLAIYDIAEDQVIRLEK